MALSRSRFTQTSCRSLGLVLGLCIAAVASPSAARRDRDDCGMQLQHICCSSPTPVVMSLSCVAKQRIPLDLGPGRFEIFVDGEKVTGSPGDLVLRADQAHVVFVKRAGYVPEMVVLRPDSQSGKPQLAPAQIKVRLRPRQVKQATVEIDFVEPEDPSSR